MIFTNERSKIKINKRLIKSFGAVYGRFLIEVQKRLRSDKVCQLKRKVRCVINFFPKKFKFNSN